ncbi:MAG: histidinol phosphate phosphatase domain-containing protein [Asgard group archaeon]|nr:histidinol phosphate phosphatase domain-containing protein [Asgard group archaeon]
MIGRCDFHTHSFLSDGHLLPMEQLRRAYAKNHVAYAITDHVGSNMDVIEKIKSDCEYATKHWGIAAIPGVELTHVPVESIDELAQKAIDNGALIVVMHGETIVEPVDPGTNLKAANCSSIDILAHPGLITKDEANACKKNDVYVEITSNRGHSLTNGHVVNVGRNENVKFIFNTDTHSPGDMLSYDLAKEVVQGAGLSKDETDEVLQENTRSFLAMILERI